MLLRLFMLHKKFQMQFKLKTSSKHCIFDLMLWLQLSLLFSCCTSICCQNLHCWSNVWILMIEIEKKYTFEDIYPFSQRFCCSYRTKCTTRSPAEGCLLPDSKSGTAGTVTAPARHFRHLSRPKRSHQDTSAGPQWPGWPGPRRLEDGAGGGHRRRPQDPHRLLQRGPSPSPCPWGARNSPTGLPDCLTTFYYWDHLSKNLHFLFLGLISMI